MDTDVIIPAGTLTFGPAELASIAWRPGCRLYKRCGGDIMVAENFGCGSSGHAPIAIKASGLHASCPDLAGYFSECH